MATERLFFGLWPDAALRERLAAARAGLAGRSGRLSHPLDLHLTLVFIGAVDEALLPCIEAAADDIAVAPFPLTLVRLADWPKPRLWVAEPGETVAPLADLVAQLQRNLLACGLAPEKRPYRPHITLARRAPPVVPLELALDWPVTDFVLAGSGGDRTPRYRIHRSWPLLP
jgi:2'-5' RNA ligase